MIEHAATCAWHRGKPCDCLPTQVPKATVLRHQIADLTEERDILARQLRAIRTVLNGEASHLARINAIRDILDGAAR